MLTPRPPYHKRLSLRFIVHPSDHRSARRSFVPIIGCGLVVSLTRRGEASARVVRGGSSASSDRRPPRPLAPGRRVRGRELERAAHSLPVHPDTGGDPAARDDRDWGTDRGGWSGRVRGCPPRLDGSAIRLICGIHERVPPNEPPTPWPARDRSPRGVPLPTCASCSRGMPMSSRSSLTRRRASARWRTCAARADRAPIGARPRALHRPWSRLWHRARGRAQAQGDQLHPCRGLSAGRGSSTGRSR